MIVVVCSAVIKKGDSFLMIKEFKPSAAGKWGLAGGQLEVGESIVEALHREVREETGYAVTSEKLIWVVNKPNASEGNTVVKFVFNCEITANPIGEAEHECDFLPMAKLQELAGQKLIRGDEIVPLMQQIIDGYGPDHSDVIKVM